MNPHVHHINMPHQDKPCNLPHLVIHKCGGRDKSTPIFAWGTIHLIGSFDNLESRSRVIHRQLILFHVDSDMASIVL